MSSAMMGKRVRVEDIPRRARAENEQNTRWKGIVRSEVAGQLGTEPIQRMADGCVNEGFIGNFDVYAFGKEERDQAMQRRP